MIKIYTKTGDKGTTRLVDGSCVDKFNPKVVAYGTVDELNAFLGDLIFKVKSLNKESLSPQCLNLVTIQHHLFRVGSLLATESDDIFSKLPPIDDHHALFLESAIDLMDTELPVLKSFILPSGSAAAISAHICRTISRRAEREIVAASQSNQRYDAIKIYMNRLSDYFFVLARYINHVCRETETQWDKSL